MTIDIQEICSRWNISRPTVMKAISELKDQLEVKDQQLADQQETNREQLRLLTYAGPALEAASSTNEEVEQLKKQLAAKEEQLEKVVHATAEQVASLMKVKAVEQPSAEETEIVLDAEQEEIARRIAVVQQERDEIEDFDHWDAGTKTSRQKKMSGSDS